MRKLHAVFILVAFAQSATAETVTLPRAGLGYVVDGSPGNGNPNGVADSGPWACGDAGSPCVVATSSQIDSRIIGEFALSPLGNAPVTSATLSLAVRATSGISTEGVSSGNLPREIRVYGYSGNGTVAQSDYAPLGLLLGSALTDPLAVGDVLSFNITSYVNSLVGTSTHMGIQVRALETGLIGFGALQVQAVTPVPLPTAGLLLVSGLIGLFGIRAKAWYPDSEGRATNSDRC